MFRLNFVWTLFLLAFSQQMMASSCDNYYLSKVAGLNAFPLENVCLIDNTTDEALLEYDSVLAEEEGIKVISKGPSIGFLMHPQDMMDLAMAHDGKVDKSFLGVKFRWKRGQDIIDYARGKKSIGSISICGESFPITIPQILSLPVCTAAAAAVGGACTGASYGSLTPVCLQAAVAVASACDLAREAVIHAVKNC